jgi:hypothetical protein
MKPDAALPPLACLVYPEESALGTTWKARSVLTGHTAEGRTATKAVHNLGRAIDAALYAAGRMGLSVREWFESQRPDDPEYLEAFARVVSLGRCSRKPIQMKAGRCTLAIARKAA